MIIPTPRLQNKTVSEIEGVLTSQCIHCFLDAWLGARGHIDHPDVPDLVAGVGSRLASTLPKSSPISALLTVLNTWKAPPVSKPIKQKYRPPRSEKTESTFISFNSYSFSQAGSAVISSPLSPSHLDRVTCSDFCILSLSHFLSSVSLQWDCLWRPFFPTRTWWL